MNCCDICKKEAIYPFETAQETYYACEEHFEEIRKYTEPLNY
jgi:hypothetical protein